MRLPALLALAVLSLAGCKSHDMPEEIASIFVEASPTVGGSLKQEVRLPVSGLPITVMTRALVPAEQILGTQPVMAGEPDLRQEFLLVQLDRKAAIDVMNYTHSGIGRHFVLVINENAVGMMPIDQPVTDGNLLFHVEQKGMSNSEAVRELSRRMNVSALKIQKIREAERK